MEIIAISALLFKLIRHILYILQLIIGIMPDYSDGRILNALPMLACRFVDMRFGIKVILGHDRFDILPDVNPVLQLRKTEGEFRLISPQYNAVVVDRQKVGICLQEISFLPVRNPFLYR